MMGTFVEVNAYGMHAAEAVKTAFAVLENADALWSFQSPCSDISRINAAGGKPVAVHHETIKLLRLCRQLMLKSSHRFNCTVGGKMIDMGVLPDPVGAPYLPAGCVNDVLLHSGCVQLLRPVRITVDGIAKGYAVDLAVHAMQHLQVEGGWVNAGGDLRVFGQAGLKIVRRLSEGQFENIGTLKNAALASSSVQSFQKEMKTDFPGRIVGGRYSQHSFDGLWTVIAQQASLADALTKVAANSTPELRAKLIGRLGGTLYSTPSLSGM